MARPAKLVECSKCHRVGRLEKNSITYRFSYPVDVIRVPGLEDAAESISAAWDYASKVCVHMSRMVLRFPPPPEKDPQLAYDIYDHFMTVTTHTNIDIAAFESLHKKLIEQRMMKKKELVARQQKQREEEILRRSDYAPLSFRTSKDKGKEAVHTPLPPDTGRITHLCLAFLYGAIVCKVISNVTYIEKKSAPESSSEHEKTAARAICTNYKMFYTDERMRKDWTSWPEIMSDVAIEGLGTAIKKHQTITAKGQYAKLSRKHVKNMKQKISQREHDIVIYIPIFERLFSTFGQHVKNNSHSAARFLLDFTKTQFSLYDQQVTYRYARVVHKKDEPCSVSPYESLRIVKGRRSYRDNERQQAV